MSYVDAFYDKAKDVVRVVERVNGKRIDMTYDPIYEFYVPDPKGTDRSVYGTKVKKIRCKNSKEFRKNLAINSHVQTYESDIKPLNKILEKFYLDKDTPVLQTAFFDIEVDFDPQRGYSSPEDAFMPITAIGVYLDWMEQMICLAVPPDTLSWEQAENIANKVGNTILFHNERDMLDAFLTIIDDADVLSGWNSEGYDIPYTVNRIIKVMGKTETRRLCLWGQQPKERIYESYGKEQKTYDIVGRIHLDYMQLYIKYNYEERHSYALDYISEMELGDRKVQYPGTLDQLYNHDFQKFLEYNIQDTILLDKLNKKLQFIDLANTIAHDNTVLIPTTMGAVATTEQAIINEAHRRGFVVIDRHREEKDGKAAGAYVATPKKGYHEWVGSMDINSLYPSVFRVLNMGPETIVGQVRITSTEKEIQAKMEGTWVDPSTGKQIPKKVSFADAWSGKFATNEYEMIMNKDTRHTLVLDLEDGQSIETTGADIYNLIFNGGKKWNISANGTIFKTADEFQGIIPGLLERWYAERKQMQAKKKEAEEAGDDAQKAFWDKRQLVKKINLNSLYGAILNVGCRFFDKRIGQSTTLTGRCITRYMAAKTNELLTGEFDYEGKCIIYGDTDSVYFSAVPILPADTELDLDNAVKLYDHVSNTVSDTFPAFLKEAFNIPLQAGTVMKAGREVVGQAGLFITKKRYAIKVLDLEGRRIPEGKMKVMGMEIKRSDTPEFIQDFLVEVLEDALSGKSENEVLEKIRNFRDHFNENSPWAIGVPKRVNNLTSYTEKYNKIKGLTKTDLTKRVKAVNKKVSNMIPGHVSASIHWNMLRDMHGDKYSMSITDGMKVIVCRLKSNPMGFDNVAYPIDEHHLPDWFKELPFDYDKMEQIVLITKVKNVLGAMRWDLDQAFQSQATAEFFDFG
jgi:DNA polymerase elongation subunit (family B)